MAITSLALLSVGGALAHQGPHYAGTLDQGRARVALHMEREGDRLFFRRFDVRGLEIPCSDGGEITLRRSVRDREEVDEDGRFRTEGRNGDRDDGRRVVVSGLVGRRSAEGRFQFFKERVGPGSGVCETGPLRWIARR